MCVVSVCECTLGVVACVHVHVALCVHVVVWCCFVCSLLSSLSSLLSSLSATMTMITRPVGSHCVHTALTCLSVRVRGLRSLTLFCNCVRIMQETTVLAFLCKLRATWNEVGMYLCWKWAMCLFVLACFIMCQYVLSSLCCWLRQCWRLCVGCCAVVTVQKKTKTTSVITEKYPARALFDINSKKIKSAPRQICNYFGADGKPESAKRVRSSRSIYFREMFPFSLSIFMSSTFTDKNS